MKQDAGCGHWCSRSRCGCSARAPRTPRRASRCSCSRADGRHRHRGLQRHQGARRRRTSFTRRRGRRRRPTSPRPSSRATRRSSSSTSAATCSTPSRRRALQGFVEDGNGFLGIGSTATVEPGSSFVNGLIGARPAQQPDDAVGADRRPRRPRAPRRRATLPLLWNRSDLWYTWPTRPTGTVHTVARYRAPNAAAGDGTERPAAPTPDLVVPRLPRRPLLLHRHGPHRGGLRRGRLQASTCSARSQWTAGLVRGDCKATINANYRGTQDHERRPDGLPASPPPASRTASRSPTTAGSSTSAAATAAPTPSAAALLGLPVARPHPRPRQRERRHRLRLGAHLRPGAVHRHGEQRRHARRHARGLRRRRPGRRAHQRRRPQDGVRPARRRRRRRTSPQNGYIYLQYFPTFNPQTLAARPAGRAAHLEDVAARASRASRSTCRPSSSTCAPRADHLRVRRPDLLLLPRRRRHGLRLRGQPLRHHG